MNVFDVIGPVMIGPSSSHTAGAVRLGNLAREILGTQVTKTVMGLYGSFAETYRGHGTDLALVAGLMGWVTDDARIPKSFQYARENGLDFKFEIIKLPEGTHPNTVKFWIAGEDDRSCTVVGASIGGGKVIITEIDDFPLEFGGDYPTILTIHQDRPGVIALVTNILSTEGVNVAQMKVFRKQKGGLAAMIVEADQPITDAEIEVISKLSAIEKVRRINTV